MNNGFTEYAKQVILKQLLRNDHSKEFLMPVINLRLITKFGHNYDQNTLETITDSALKFLEEDQIIEQPYNKWILTYKGILIWQYHNLLTLE